MSLVFIFLLLFLSPSLQQRIIPVQDPNNILITFGSCNRYKGEDENHILYKVAAMNPDVWIWLGDAAYTDHRLMPMIFTYAGETKIVNSFNQVKKSSAYQNLLKNPNTTVIGVWDDHDYGINNGGKHFLHKTLTQQLYLDFLDEPEDSPRRKQEGIYESYYIGDQTKIKVILLDVRYFKDEASVLGDGDMLGEAQWEWLEEQLKNNKAKYTLIGSGVQILHDDRLLPEHWYRWSRHQLLELIKKYKVSGVVLLSGDVHYTEIMKHPCRERVGFDLYEFTSSGLTISGGDWISIGKELIDSFYPNTFNTEEDRIFQYNFGALKFDFSGERPHLTMEAKNKTGQTIIKRDVDYARLTFDEELLNHHADCVLDTGRFGRLVDKILESLLEPNGYIYLIIAFFTLIFWILVLIMAALHGIVGFVFKLFGKDKQQKKIKEARAKQE